MISEATKQRILEMRRVMDAMGVTATTADAETASTLTGIWRRLGRQHPPRAEPVAETAKPMEIAPLTWSALKDGHAFVAGDTFTYRNKVYVVLAGFDKRTEHAPPTGLDTLYRLA